jgi:hypothetical protein
MPTPLSAPRVLPRVLVPPQRRRSDHTLLRGTAGPSGPTVPPPAPNAPSGPIAASSGKTTHETEAGGPTATPGSQTAQPFMAPSSPALPTSVAPYAVTTTSAVPHTASTTPPALTSMTLLVPPMASASQHYSRQPWAAREPPTQLLHQQSPPA